MRPLPLVRRFAAALLLCAGALGAPSAARAGDGFECPQRGGPEWRELRSAHFVLVTDLSARKAKALSRELETIHRAVQGALFRTPPPAQGLVRVVAFEREEEFRTFAPERAGAYYLRVRGEPTVVLPGGFGERERMVLAHELAHDLLARVFARQPRWFSEGIACFVESVGMSGPDSPPTVGGIPRHHYQAVYPYHGGAGPLLLGKGPLASAREYGLAWALVHFLSNARPSEFAALQTRFQSGRDPLDAWREVFPQWDPATAEGAKALDRELGKYLGTGKFGYRDLRLEKDHPEPAQRTLSASEVHALRLVLPRLAKAPDPKAVAAELTEALAEDPGNVAALALLARGTPAEARVFGTRATEAHPEDVWAWLLLGGSGTAEQREAALRKAVEVGPEHAVALNELAWFLVETERAGEAIPFAARAVRLASWDHDVLDTAGAALHHVGRCTEALVVQRRAVDVMPEGTGARTRFAILSRLAKIEASCAGAKPGGAVTPAAR